MSAKRKQSTISPGPAWNPARRARVEEFIRKGWIKSGDEVPPGALLADPDKQRSCSVMGGRMLWYVDLWFACKSCRKREKWLAGSQKWWYEVAGGEVESTAVLCRSCRLSKRAADKAAAEKTEEAKRQRAQRKARELAQELRAQGSDVMARLDLPITVLGLRERAVQDMLGLGVKTLHDLVAMDTGRAWPVSITKLKQKLAGFGLRFTGARLPEK